jgi:hypothetical protein
MTINTPRLYKATYKGAPNTPLRALERRTSDDLSTVLVAPEGMVLLSLYEWRIPQGWTKLTPPSLVPANVHTHTNMFDGLPLIDVVELPLSELGWLI